jgi:hypothetical protein
LANIEATFSTTALSLGRLFGSREFLLARLVTTNPRPKPVQQAMAHMIHHAFRQAIESEPRSYWWQCCVLIEPFERQDYLKTDSRALGSTEARGLR